MSLGMDFTRRRLMTLSKEKPKYIWAVYSLGYVLDESSATTGTFSATRTRTKMASTTYTASASGFTLTNATSTSLQNLAVGQYLVNVSTSSNTSTTGTYLYEVTSKSGSSTVTISYTRYTSTLAKGDTELYRVESDTLEYPRDGEYNGYWYVLIQGVCGSLVVYPKLNDNSWETIAAVAAAGEASLWWKVGDYKQFDMVGTVGDETIDNTLAEYEGTGYDNRYGAFILGFNHNGAQNTIDFGLLYWDYTGIFGEEYAYMIMAFTDINRAMNRNSRGEEQNNHKGGWKGCDARYDVLGSTDIKPTGYNSGNRTGYDASPTCATNPVPNTIMAALPEDLRRVMKPMTIYTDNVGSDSNSSGDVASSVTASIDYLPLLSEFEIWGKTDFANPAEARYQAQYEYFIQNGVNLRYKTGNPFSTTTGFGTRSPWNIITGPWAAVVRENIGDESVVYVAAMGYDSSNYAPIFRV